MTSARAECNQLLLLGRGQPETLGNLRTDLVASAWTVSLSAPVAASLTTSNAIPHPNRFYIPHTIANHLHWQAASRAYTSDLSSSTIPPNAS